MKIVAIGIILIVGGSIILGWLIKEAYKNYKNESTKTKIFYFLWMILGLVLDLSNGLIIIVGLIFIRSSFNNLFPTLQLTGALVQ